ncbi:MAG TPA: hypothetical protein VM712_15780 [Gaiellales bacterium]|jgi:hypothetical protein|nr:hypothetical protein [Gaiellales bacterium]
MHKRTRNRRRGGLLMLVAVALIALLVPALGTAADTSSTAAIVAIPDQVADLSGGAPTIDGGAVTSITPAQAYGAANDSATITQVDDGLTLQQAVGLQSMSVVASAPVYCWRWVPSVQWGTWPYQQKVHNDVSWCAAYGDHITSWSTHVTLGASLCDPSGPYGYKQVGGVGDGVVRLRAGGYFACPTTIPWITYHYNRWFDTSFYTRGSAAVVATS